MRTLSDGDSVGKEDLEKGRTREMVDGEERSPVLVIGGGSNSEGRKGMLPVVKGERR